MQIVARRTLKQFWAVHDQAEVHLRAWFAQAAVAVWNSPQDIKREFGTNVDFVGDNRVIFATRELPRTGAVLGIDVGYSTIRRSSAVCRLEWDDQRIMWHIERFRAVAPEQEAAISRIAGGRRLEAAAFDGP